MTFKVRGFNIKYPGIIMVPAQIGEFSKDLRYTLSKR